MSAGHATARPRIMTFDQAAAELQVNEHTLRGGSGAFARAAAYAAMNSAEPGKPGRATRLLPGRRK